MESLEKSKTHQMTSDVERRRTSKELLRCEVATNDDSCGELDPRTVYVLHEEGQEKDGTDASADHRGEEREPGGEPERKRAGCITCPDPSTRSTTRRRRVSRRRHVRTQVQKQSIHAVSTVYPLFLCPSCLSAHSAAPLLLPQRNPVPT